VAPVAPKAAMERYACQRKAGHPGEHVHDDGRTIVRWGGAFTV
jgi:hypothetical protein